MLLTLPPRQACQHKNFECTAQMEKTKANILEKYYLTRLLLTLLPRQASQHKKV